MKEASGELSMTAITVVAIAALAVLATTVIYPAIKRTIDRNLHCGEVVKCDAANAGDKTRTCYYLDDTGSTKTVLCPNQD